MFELIAIICFCWTIVGGIIFALTVLLASKGYMPGWLGYTAVIVCGPVYWLFACVLFISAHRSGKLWRHD